MVCADLSALFVLFKKVTLDRVLPEFARYEGRVLQTSLSNEQEEKLKAALAHHLAQPA